MASRNSITYTNVNKFVSRLEPEPGANEWAHWRDADTLYIQRIRTHPYTADEVSAFRRRERAALHKLYPDLASLRGEPLVRSAEELLAGGAQPGTEKRIRPAPVLSVQQVHRLAKGYLATIHIFLANTCRSFNNPTGPEGWHDASCQREFIRLVEFAYLSNNVYPAVARYGPNSPPMEPLRHALANRETCFLDIYERCTMEAVLEYCDRTWTKIIKPLTAWPNRSAIQNMVEMCFLENATIAQRLTRRLLKDALKDWPIPSDAQIRDAEVRMQKEGDLAEELLLQARAAPSAGGTEAGHVSSSGEAVPFLQSKNGVWLCYGKPLVLDRAFEKEVFSALVSNPGEFVSASSIAQERAAPVEESPLTVAISRLRKTLGDHYKEHRQMSTASPLRKAEVLAWRRAVLQKTRVKGQTVYRFNVEGDAEKGFCVAGLAKCGKKRDVNPPKRKKAALVRPAFPLP